MWLCPTTALERTTHIWQAPARDLLALATLTVNRELIEEVEHFADHTILWFGGAFEPDRIVLTGDDRMLWHASAAVEYLRSQGEPQEERWTPPVFVDPLPG